MGDIDVSAIPLLSWIKYHNDCQLNEKHELSISTARLMTTLLNLKKRIMGITQ